jgi:hypothetical protein
MQSVLPTDIVIHRPNGPFVAAVEVKNREGLTKDLAATLRRNLLAHGIISADVPFFLLVSQDQGFLWRNVGRPGLELVPPDAEFPMLDVIRRYAPDALGERLRESELESIIFSWLGDLSQSDRPSHSEPEATLDRLGFPDAVRGAFVTRQVA